MTEENNIITPVERFWLLIKPDKKEIRNVYIYSLFYSLVGLSLPLGIQTIINFIQGGQISTSWVLLVVFVLLGIIVKGILKISQLRITENLQQKIFTRASFEFTYRLPRIKLEELYKHYAPELMNRFFDVISVQKGLSKILIDFSTALIQTIFGLILLSLYHPFFIVFSLTLVFLVYFMIKVTAKEGLDTSLKESKSKYAVAHWLQELARTSISFKLAGITKLPLLRTNKILKSYIKARDDHFEVLKKQYILMVAFNVLVTAGLLIIGSLLVIEQKMNIGQFVASEIIILLVIGAVEKLVLSFETIYDVLTSLEKIGQVTDLKLEVEKGKKLESPHKGLHLEANKLSFKYPEQKNFILNDISFSIESGENILLTGGSDTGKSTLLYVVSGLFKIEYGSILFNEIPLANINPYHLRSMIGDCLMDELLFDGTLLENITMGREKATFENVQWAFDKLGLLPLVKSLPQGYDTMINPQGKLFSRGIIEKLLLARSIADKPKLLLIKDSFTSLGKEEKTKIIDFLIDPANNWTMIIASKDDDIKQKMDRVFVLENGCLTIEN